MTARLPRIDKTRLAICFGSRASSYDAVTPVQAEMVTVLVGHINATYHVVYIQHEVV